MAAEDAHLLVLTFRRFSSMIISIQMLKKVHDSTCPWSNLRRLWNFSDNLPSAFTQLYLKWADHTLVLHFIILFAVLFFLLL